MLKNHLLIQQIFMEYCIQQCSRHQRTVYKTGSYPLLHGAYILKRQRREYTVKNYHKLSVHKYDRFSEALKIKTLHFYVASFVKLLYNRKSYHRNVNTIGPDKAIQENRDCPHPTQCLSRKRHSLVIQNILVSKIHIFSLSHF